MFVLLVIADCWSKVRFLKFVDSKVEYPYGKKLSVVFVIVKLSAYTRKFLEITTQTE